MVTLRAGFEKKDPVVAEGKHHSDITIKPVRKFNSTEIINVLIILIIELFNLKSEVQLTFIFNCDEKFITF